VRRCSFSLSHLTHRILSELFSESAHVHVWGAIPQMPVRGRRGLAFYWKRLQKRLIDSIGRAKQTQTGYIGMLPPRARFTRRCIISLLRCWKTHFRPPRDTHRERRAFFAPSLLYYYCIPIFWESSLKIFSHISGGATSKGRSQKEEISAAAAVNVWLFHHW
jgi:hypothetical protein